MLKINKTVRILSYILAPLIMPLVATSQQAQDTATQKRILQGLGGDIGVNSGFAKGALDSLAASVKPVRALFGKNTFLAIGDAGIDIYHNNLHDTSGLGLGVFRDLQGTFSGSANLSVSLMNMPFDFVMRGNNGLYSYSQTGLDRLGKFNFNHAKYLEDIRSKVASGINPSQITDAALKRLGSIRKKYEDELRTELNNLQGEFAEKYKAQLAIPDGVTDLSVSDIGSLKSKLLNSREIENYRANSEKYQQLLQAKGGELTTGDSASNSVLHAVKRYEALEKAYAKIIEWKGRFDNNKTVQELRSHLPVNEKNIASYLSNPASLKKIAKENFSMSSLQRLFMNITRLDIGQNALQQPGDFSLQNIMNTGVNTAFMNEKLSASFVQGSNNNVNNWLQSGLQSGITNEYSSLSGFKIGTGSKAAFSQTVSFNVFNFKSAPDVLNRPENLQSTYLPSANYGAAVINLHSSIPVSGKNRVEVDLSKSFSSFSNGLLGDNTTSGKSNAGKIFSNEGKSNYAIKVDYKGELLKTNINLFVKKVGLGYNNPGNYLLRRGETQLGWSLEKQLEKNKLKVKYAGDYRAQTFDPSRNYTYNSLSNKLFLSYRLKKNNRFALTYHRSDYTSRFYAQPVTHGANTRLQAEAMYKF